MRAMNKEEIEYAAIRNAIGVISVICGVAEEGIIRELTGLCWDEEEAGGINRSDGKFHYIVEEKE